MSGLALELVDVDRSVTLPSTDLIEEKFWYFVTNVYLQPFCTRRSKVKFVMNETFLNVILIHSQINAYWRCYFEEYLLKWPFLGTFKDCNCINTGICHFVHHGISEHPRIPQFKHLCTYINVSKNPNPTSCWSRCHHVY